MRAYSILLMILLMAACAPQALGLSTSGIMAHFSLTGYTDSAGYINNLTGNGTQVTGKIAYAMNFSNQTASGRKFAFTKHPQLRTTTGLSINVWINPYQNPPDHLVNIVSYSNNSGADYYGYVLSGRTTGGVIFDIWSGGSSCRVWNDTSPLTLKLNTWTMVTGVYSDTYNWMAVYLNTTLMKNITCAETIAYPADNYNFAIGGYYEIGTTSPQSGNYTIDELTIWNRTINQSDIAELWNSGAGMVIYPASAPISLNITTPANNSHENLLNISYHFNSTGVPSALCCLYVNALLMNCNNSLNSTNYFILNNTIADSAYTYYMNCTNSTSQNISAYRNITIDNVNPQIITIEPAIANTSVYDLHMHIFGTASDLYLYRANITIRNISGNVMYNNFTDSIAAVTFNYSQPYINTTNWSDGVYSMFAEVSDSHTNNIFTAHYAAIKTDYGARLLLEDKDLNFTSDKFTDINFIKAGDRLNFEITAPVLAEKTIIITANADFKKINSEYPCHYVFGDYWIDAAGLKGAVCFLQSPNTLVMAYAHDKLSVTAQSIGGLNIVMQNLTFAIAHCSPVWACSAYGACNGTYNICLSAVDTAACGTAFTGNLSVFNTPCSSAAGLTEIFTLCLLCFLGLALFAFSFIFRFSILTFFSSIIFVVAGFYYFNNFTETQIGFVLLGISGFFMLAYMIHAFERE